ncbi:hypothetical protein J6590_077203 [Homalodisca vitripennis]|nr:hypothetical protein J6590_077203 [Homalodisca vitripennis]
MEMRYLYNNAYSVLLSLPYLTSIIILSRESMEFAHRQLNIAEEADSPNLRAEAYLNLARTHERMGALERALACARHSLYNECDQCRTAGLVQITVGSVHLELATFCKALQAFQQAHTIAQRIQDPALELQSVQSHVLLEGSSGSTFVRSVASCQQDLRHLWRMFELSFQQDASFRQYFW